MVKIITDVAASYYQTSAKSIFDMQMDLAFASGQCKAKFNWPPFISNCKTLDHISHSHCSSLIGAAQSSQRSGQTQLERARPRSSFEDDRLNVAAGRQTIPRSRAKYKRR